MIHDVYDQDHAVRLQFSKNPKRRTLEMYARVQLISAKHFQPTYNLESI